MFWIMASSRARTAGGEAVADAAPEWSLAPGNGQVDHDGGFVADLPGTYRVLATFAGKTAEAMVEVRPRDVRRPTTLVGRLPLPFPTAEFWLHPDGKHVVYRLSGSDVADLWVRLREVAETHLLELGVALTQIAAHPDADARLVVGRDVVDFNYDDTTVTNTGHFILALDAIMLFTGYSLFLRRDLHAAGVKA